MIDFSAYVKYSRPGPRYTSYPTAPEFSDKFSYEAYIKELEILAHHLDTSAEVLQMHFGGGTPTFYNAAQLDEIIKLIKAKFKNFSKEAEISCEIDPRFLTNEQLDVLISHGFNRISYGVQDFDEKVQKEIHRIQPYEITQNAVKMARQKGIKSINMDLIYGLPYQSLESFKKTLELALTLDPDRLAVFNYAHVPWIKKSMRKFDEFS